jgi:hypothetical protein
MQYRRKKWSGYLREMLLAKPGAQGQGGAKWHSRTPCSLRISVKIRIGIFVDNFVGFDFHNCNDTALAAQWLPVIVDCMAS